MIKIKGITIDNFIQYFDTVTYDLNTDSKKNIVLIGDKKGYGKTNFCYQLSILFDYIWFIRKALKKLV